jgi:hypothetical protein
VWCGVVWCGVVWCGVVWCGVVWCGVVVVWCVYCVLCVVGAGSVVHITSFVVHVTCGVMLVYLRLRSICGEGACVHPKYTSNAAWGEMRSSCVG